MEAITRLWLAERLPIRDGLYRSDGSARDVRVDEMVSGGLALLESFNLEAFLEPDPEETTSIMVTGERELPDRAGYLCCGEGSYGSEGFFARLDQSRELMWVVYLENANPFVQINVAGTQAGFLSSSGVSVTVDLTGPDFGPSGPRDRSLPTES
ncbi:hypothetical protein [Micromonospora sp. NPDC049171]|uniref:hypothetical protein n=1 Tax=Micromonospora sp. NPDC049171 TaxID=3155770 RepID=UPI0033E32167